jgi:hypothetical protein
MGNDRLEGLDLVEQLEGLDLVEQLEGLDLVDVKPAVCRSQRRSGERRYPP